MHRAEYLASEQVVGCFVDGGILLPMFIEVDIQFMKRSDNLITRSQSDVLNAAVKLRDLTGQMPMYILSRTLQMTSQQDQILQKRDRGEIDQASIERWESDGTFDELYAEDLIRCGALQFLASEFLGQMTQRGAGDSEMHEGIRELNKMREEKRKRLFGPPRVAKSAKRKPKKKL